VRTGSAEYAFANARAVQRERLGLLAQLFDEGTYRSLEALGVQRGWRCLEVGAGGGSVASWLCERVAPDGSVLATDLETTVLAERERPGLEVRKHDLLRDELPEQEFDLVHARLVLAWLPDPQLGLRRMVAALRAGGRALVEEMDFLSVAPASQCDGESRGVFARVIEAHNAVLAERHAFDPFYGRRLEDELAGVGLVGTSSEARIWIWHGGQPGGRVWQLTLVQLRNELAASGLVSAEEVDQAVALLADPAFRFVSQIVVSSWGCRAPAG
jgi:SAM-dependent methyltransferase